MAGDRPQGPPSSLLKHLETRKDAVKGGDADDETEIVLLYNPAESDRKSADDELLWDLTGKTNDSEPCRLLLEDGTILPPKEMSSACRLSIRFKDLWFAPAILLQCEWPSTADEASSECLKLSLEFHFNSLTEGVDGIQTDLRMEKDVMLNSIVADEMTFSCREAACAGFNRIERYRKQIGSRGMQVHDALYGLIKPATAQKVRLRFQGQFREGSSGLSRLLGHLPGGSDWPLPSLSYGDWASYLTNGFDLHDILSPEQLMNGDVKHLMVPSPSSNTFATLADASRQLRYAANYSYLLQKWALQLWAETKHYGSVYRVETMAIMVVRFNKFDKLGSAKKEKKFSLPDGLECKMFFKDFKKDPWICRGKLITAPIRLPDNQAVFAITSHEAKAFEKIFYQPGNKNTGWMDIKFEPHVSKFQFDGQKETARRIDSPSTARWHPVILNQLHADLPAVDLITGETVHKEKPKEDKNEPMKGANQTETQDSGERDDLREAQTSKPQNTSTTAKAAKAEKAFQRLLSARIWNAEQVEALKRIRNAPGGIVLISGPPGTGKTELAQAASAMFDEEGLHVLVVAPQNANCTNWMPKLNKAFPKVNALRIFPGAIEEDLKDVNESRDKHRKTGHDGRASTNAIDFDICLAALDATEKYTGRELGLQAVVLDAARKGEREFKGYLRDATGRQISSKLVNYWQVLRECIEKSKAKKFNWDNDFEKQSYLYSFKMCKEQYVAQQKYVVTTTGNVRCSEIKDHWARGLHGCQCEGIVIIIDEACKDKEIDTLAAMLSAEHIGKIRGVIMLGDERQLEPTNMSSKDKLIFSAFPQRESISLFARLKAEGYPCTELKEQHRMHQYISWFIFKYFYPKGMRNAPGMTISLRDDEPGLRLCMRKFLRDTLGESKPKLNDGDYRTHYLQIKGVRKQDPDSGSFYVREHIQVFFNTIFWYLHAYYGSGMQDNVMIIAAYGYALRLWKQASAFIQNEYKLSEKDVPSIRCAPECTTIDSSQGREANVVFLDCSVQDPDKLGFVDDDKRMNVACSRGKKVFWILGGDCSDGSEKEKTPAYIKYYESLEASGRVLNMKNTAIQNDGSGWMYELKKKEVNLTLR